jgi:REP element-mobilizing transposase RayT
LNSIVTSTLETHSARLHAYCWMTNHLHFLLQVGDEPLSSVMRTIASGYARAFQKKLETTGHLFECRYHAVLISGDTHLLEALRYVHLNPVDAGICASPQQYPWSSHKSYAGEANDPLVTTGTLLRIFAADRARACARYCEFVNRRVATLEPRRDCAAEAAHPDSMEFLPNSIDREHVRQGTNRPTLDSVIGFVCAEFRVDRDSLRTTRRHDSIARIRARIAARALACGAGNLSEIARELQCDRKTLREAMRKHGEADVDIPHIPHLAPTPASKP